MNKLGKIGIVIILLAAIVVVFAIKQKASSNDDIDAFESIQIVGKGLPVLVDLGSDKCQFCKMMAPILEELFFLTFSP